MEYFHETRELAMEEIRAFLSVQGFAPTEFDLDAACRYAFEQRPEAHMMYMLAVPEEDLSVELMAYRLPTSTPTA